MTSRTKRVDKDARLKKAIANEIGRSESEVPDLWIARAVANGNPVQSIDEVDGGFDITVQRDFDRYVLSLRAESGVDLKVGRPR
jgi:ABC-type Na+ transport system ATPase subunit NatA